MKKPIGPCQDCPVDIFQIKEYYMLNDELWLDITKGDKRIYLCIGCVEKRLGRKLRSSDFMEAPINYPDSHKKSERLMDRLNAAS